MDTTKFTMGIVGLVVIILMVTGAVLPAVEDAQKEQYSEKNNTTQRFTMASISDEIVIGCDASGVIINDVHYDVASSLTTIAIGEDLQISYYKPGPTLAVQSGTLYSGTAVSTAETVTLSNGEFTVSKPTPVTGTYTSPLYLLSSSGDYGVFSGINEGQFGISNESTLWAFVQVAFTIDGVSTSVRGIVSGTPTDIHFVDAWDNTAGTAIALEDITVSWGTAPDKVDDVHYLISHRNITVKYTVDDVEYSADSTFPNGILAPIEYKYISDNDASVISLIGIIPLLLIIVAVLYAVRLMGASRN